MSPSVVSMTGVACPYRTLNLAFDNADSEASARRLIFALHPEWESSEGPVEFERFKDGITNTLYKAMKRHPGWDQHQIDQEAVLLRAYGNNTDVLIDREREARSHSLLAKHGLAPALLARFDNGLLYKFIEGFACSPEDLQRPDVWPSTARRLGQWHAILPLSEAEATCTEEDTKYAAINRALEGKPIPNIWTTMRRWVDVLPEDTEEQRQQKQMLQEEVEHSAELLGKTEGLDHGRFILSHCDLLSGNVIVHPKSHESNGAANGCTDTASNDVSFIDYEYANPAPAAFDIANHFAEWGGFECNYELLPTQSQRRRFVEQYVESYRLHKRQASNGHTNGHSKESSLETDVDRLVAEVDDFRGMPGLYWGIWALIQAMISQIDFDYAGYAPIRLKEYWDWKAERLGSRKQQGGVLSLREQRLAQEA